MFTVDSTAPSITCAKKYLEYKIKGGAEPTFEPPKVVIFLYQKSFWEKVITDYQCTPCDGYFRQLYFLDHHPGVGIIYFGPGAAYNAAKLESLRAWGVKKVISMGTAGALQHHLSAGDQILCDRAVRDEGVSHHYLPPAEYADSCPKMLAELKSSFIQENFPYKIGASRTLDTFYRQTAKDILRLQKAGVLAVEMEAAALFAVGERIGVSVGAMFTISDSLADLTWSPYFDDRQTEEGLYGLLKVAITTAVNSSE
jgi:uridine phosphorylase